MPDDANGKRSRRWSPINGATASFGCFMISAGSLTTLAVPTHGGAPRRICRQGNCLATWSSDGRFFYVLHSAFNTGNTAMLAAGRTVAIPVPRGKSLPDLPADGLDLAAQRVAAPGSRMIDHDLISPGPDPSIYVFTKTDLQRNLFRIPLH
jgi:hypothetical protein